MLKIVTDGDSIRKYEEQLVNEIEKFTSQKIVVNIGYQGGRVEKREIRWLSELGMWSYSRENDDGKYWNAFGLQKPKEGKNVSITCEINFVLSGINPRIAGGFAYDEAGEIYIIHSGKINRVKKSLFESAYRGEWVEIEDKGKLNRVALISSFSSKHFLREIKEFVQEVDRIKSLGKTR